MTRIPKHARFTVRDDQKKEKVFSHQETLELTFVVWQRDVKVTFAKGSESPVLSAAMSPLA